MKKQDHIKYWLKTAAHDFQTARVLLKEKKYDWCLFISHLALEKALKALWVRDHQGSAPPKTHNLMRLVDEIWLNINENDKLLLLDFNDFNLEVRYPDYKLQFYKKCDKAFTEKYFQEIKRIYRWLKKQI